MRRRRRYRQSHNYIPWHLSEKYIFAPNARLQHIYKPFFRAIFEQSSLVWDGMMVTEKLIEAGVIDEKFVVRSPQGDVIRFYFVGEWPSLEEVERICLTPEEIKKVDFKIERGLV